MHSTNGFVDSHYKLSREEDAFDADNLIILTELELS